MSSDLFKVRILSRKGAAVLVEVTDTYHGISAPETEAFFLAALYEPARGSGAPLDLACTVEQMCDEDFVVDHLREYVAAVEVVEARSPAQATYKVVFTDPKWTEHLRPKLTWGTASYDLGEPDLRRALDKAASRAPARPKKTASKKLATKTASRAPAAKKKAAKKRG